MSEIITKILDLLDKCENAIEVAQLVLFALVTRRCSKLSHAAEILSSGSTIPEEIKETSTVSPKQLKKQYTDLFKEGYDLYISDKDEADMTSDELQKFEAVKTFIEGGM